MTTVVIPESLLETIGHLLTPGGLELPPQEEVRALVRSVAMLGDQLLADGRELSVRNPSELKLPIIGDVTHLSCTPTGMAPTVGVACERTGRGLQLHVIMSETGVTVVGATVTEASDDPSQPCGWIVAAIDGVETRGWQFAGEGWSTTLLAERRGAEPWAEVCIRRVGERVNTSTGAGPRFENLRDAFDALIERLPSAAAPERAWLPDSRLHAPGHERVNIPRSTLQRIAALLVAGGAPLPPEDDVQRLVTELLRIGAPLVRIGGNVAGSLPDVTLPLLGRATTRIVRLDGPRSTIAVGTPDGTLVGIDLANVDGRAEVRGAQYALPPAAGRSVQVLKWAHMLRPDDEAFEWTLRIDGDVQDVTVSRDLDATTWTADQLAPPAAFATPQDAFDAVTGSLIGALQLEDPDVPDSRLRD